MHAPRSPLARAGLVALLLLSAGWGRCEGTSDGDPVSRPTNWTLYWSDDFDGSAGTLPSPAIWTPETGGGGWGNNELQYYTDRPVNAALDGQGHLAIVARQESFGGRNYTSARLITKGKLEFTHGKVEARLKLPAGQGLWPAFWMLGANISTVSWPACGEIDIMEFRGQEPRVAFGTVHGPGYSGGQSIGMRYTIPAGAAALDQDFHVYGVEWNPGLIVFSLDGIEYFSVKPSDLPSGTEWVFDKPFFLLLNVAVGGNFVGPVGTGVTFPQTMLVDWVKVWEAAP